VYVANKEKACSRVGITNLGAHLAADTPAAEVQTTIERLNADPAVDGILLQLPLPAGLDEGPLLAAIDPAKDADGLHTLNLGRLLKGEPGPRSCTPAGVMALLAAAGVTLAGKRAVVVGRSILVGQPMALMLQAANATVTVAHSRTSDLAAVTRQADVLVVAAGRAGMIGSQHVQPGAVVVDVGIHRKPEGGLCGDVRFDEVAPIASAISPVPGGIGPMTVTMLLVNTVSSWCARCGLSNPLADLLP
jgi:methylenetetrahydrofolate dehydrogenase (NADP+)/methenyltetrahydrofolate cyclohydrolase